MKKVIAFIPVFNEEDSIEKVIDTVFSTYPIAKTEKKGYLLEILVINDGSTDSTDEIIKQKKVSIVSHSVNRGLGAATRTAMNKCYELGADICIKLDADFQHDPDDIEKTIMPIIKNETDICWGSRFKEKTMRCSSSLTSEGLITIRSVAKPGRLRAPGDFRDGKGSKRLVRRFSTRRSQLGERQHSKKQPGSLA